MNNVWRKVCLSVFVIGIVAYTASFSQSPMNPLADAEPASPYIVITAHYQIDPNGVRIDQGQRIRYVKANGEWRQSAYNGADIKKDSAVFASTEEGVFAKASGIPERKFVSQPADQHTQECFRSVNFLTKQKSFARIEELAGLKVYVLRYEITDTQYPIGWIEESFSPKTGYISLRHVKHFRDGSELVDEAIKVEFQDVPDDLNGDLHNLPIRQKDK